MKSKPYFSIIIPSYNQGKYLEKTLGSIEQQSFRDWEVIILDGGSKDNSVKQIKEFSKRNKGRVVWRSHKDKGQVTALNEGLDKATGQVVAYINSDDYYEPDAFKKVYDFFSKSSRFWVYGNCHVTQKNLGWTFLYKWLWRPDIFSFTLYLLNVINQPTVFMKRKIIDKVGHFDNEYKLAFDYDYWLRCQKHSKPGRLNEYLATFRVHKRSKSSEQFISQFNEELMILKKNEVNLGYYYLHLIHNLAIVTFYRFLK